MPTEILVKINGDTVYEGLVPTEDAPVNSIDQQRKLFVWSVPIEDPGPFKMEVRSFFGDLLLAHTMCNHVWCYIHNGEILKKQPPWPGGEDFFGPCFDKEIAPGIIARDALSEIRLDGLLKTQQYTKEHQSQSSIGQWRWTVPDGSVFTCQVNLNRNVRALPWKSDREYRPRQFVSFDNRVYDTWTSVPAGVDPTNRYYWFDCPILPWNPDLRYTQYQRVWYQDQAWVAQGIVEPGVTPGEHNLWENEWPNWNAFK